LEAINIFDYKNSLKLKYLLLFDAALAVRQHFVGFDQVNMRPPFGWLEGSDVGFRKRHKNS
jgi:hypothetical protein